LGYGPQQHSLEAFLGSMGSLTSPIRLGVRSQAYEPRICLRFALHPCPGSTIARVELPSCVTPLLAYYRFGSRVPPTHPEGLASFVRLASPASAWACCHGYGNINPLSIDYACRPRLRSRLTLGGLAWPRNPWSFGGRVSRPSFATHACILTRVASTAGSLRCFTRHTTLPYPSTRLGAARRQHQA
jgi:hypothetical protein